MLFRAFLGGLGAGSVGGAGRSIGCTGMVVFGGGIGYAGMVVLAMLFVVLVTILVVLVLAVLVVL